MRQQKSAWLFPLLFSATLALGACGGSGGKPSEQVLDEDLTQYGKASCQYQLTEGPSALAKMSTRITADSFGKRLDLNLLIPVLGASAAETIRFAESTDVRFYKTAAYLSSGSCDLLGHLPAAPSDIEERIIEYSKQTNVLGLYLGVGSPGFPGTNQVAAITVRRDANKWVLVHEYLHHLFQIQLDADNGRRIDAKMQLLSTASAYESAVKDYSKTSIGGRSAAISAITSAYVEYGKAMLALLSEYYLEEMVIEDLMGKQFEKGLLTYVIAEQRVNGAAYILKSSDKALKPLEEIEKDLREIRLKYELSSADIERIQALQRKVMAFKAEMGPLKGNAAAFLKSRGLVLKGAQMMSLVSGESSPVTHSVGCSHTHDADEILNQLSARMRHVH